VQAEGLEMPPVLAKNNTPPLRSEQQLLDTLAQFAEKIVITFMPPEMPGELGSSYGITSKMFDPNLKGACNDWDFVISMINPEIIWPLLEQDESSSSKAQAALIFAVTLAHEMIHAIYKVKNMLVPRADIHIDEPFYAPPGTDPKDSAWICELGVSWEQSIMGGTLVECPPKRGLVGASGGSLFTCSTEDPNWSIWRAYGIGLDVAAHEFDTWNGYSFPSFVAELYCSDEFWQTHFVKYGLPALQAPQLFRTQIDRDGPGVPEICQLEYALPDFRPRLEELGQRFKTRGSQWSRLRPWYHNKRKEWAETPYSRSWLRDYAGRFRVAHRAGDEWTAQECYRLLGAIEQWGDTFASQGFLLDQDQDWIDQAVGYLMMTIMPIRTSRETRKLTYFPVDYHTPGAAAAADAAARSAKPFEICLADGDGEEHQLLPRNVPFAPNDPLRPLGNRETLLEILRDEIQNLQRLYPVPDPVFQEIKAMYNNVDREAPKCRFQSQWLSTQIKFALPPWRTELQKTKVGYCPSSLYEPYNHSAQPLQHAPGTALPPQQGSAGRSHLRHVARSARRAAATVGEAYHTVGEVANHVSTGDLWIISGDGAYGYDVYDATDIVEEMWADKPEAFCMDDHCERTLLGLKARPDFRETLEKQANRLGKLILPMRRHEIAERDGKHGKPFWISVGNDVFDISNFPFRSETERNLLRKCPGGNPWRDIVKDGQGTIDYSQLVTDLKPYRCAVVAAQTPDEGPGPADEFHFTRQEVACHTYPETTMYTIIRGHVYDLTGYMEFHPGGEAILRQCAGKDSTSEFVKYHADADRCLKDYGYLRLGRLVEEKLLNQLAYHEVALNGHVYDLGKIDPRKPAPQLVRAIDSYGLRGKDITAVLNNRSMARPKGLCLLAERPDLITAKLSVRLPEIDLATLAANNGSRILLPKGMKVPPDRVEVRDLRMPLWVSYGGLVYDMTVVSKYGPDDIKRQLDGYDFRYRSAVLPPSALATRLQQEYSCRVIGRLGGNLGRSREEENSGSGGLGERPRQRLRLL
jgi:cytochrome b involved in lipid metabolism